MSNLLKDMALNKPSKSNGNYVSTLQTEAEKLVKALGTTPANFEVFSDDKDIQSQDHMRPGVSGQDEHSLNIGVDNFEFATIQPHHCLAFFYAFIYAAENSQNLRDILKNEIKKTSEYSLLGDFFEDPDYKIVKDDKIVNKALEYTLDTRSPLATKYVLGHSKRLRINGRVSYEQIEDLVADYPATVNIILQLINNDVLYSCVQKQTYGEDIDGDSVKDKSQVDEEWDKSKEDSKHAEAYDEQINQAKLADELRQRDDSKGNLNASQNVFVGFEIDYSNLPDFQTVDCGYVERECIVEAAFRCPKIDGSTELEIIMVLYEGLNRLEENQRLMLFKCVTAYDRLELILAIYELVDFKKSGEYAKKTNAMVFDSRIAKTVNTQFDLIEFIGDIVLYAISSDNIVLVLKIIEKFKRVLAGKSIEIIDAIVDSLVYQYESDVMITYPFEKLRIICIVSRMYTADTPSVLKFLTVFENLLYQSTHLNFIINYYNPLRLFAMMVRTCDKMNDTVTTVDSGFEKILDSYEDLVIRIIDVVNPPGVLRNWLFDNCEHKIKVIDYLAYYKRVDILKHVKVVKTVEHIWYGVYDYKSYSTVSAFLRTSTEARHFSKLNVDLESALSNVGTGRWFNSFYYLTVTMCMNNKEILEANRDYNQNKIDFKKHELVKLEAFTMKSWNEGMSDIFYFDYFYMWYYYLVMIWSAILMIYYADKVERWEKTIAESGTTNSRLDKMYTAGQTWDFYQGGGLQVAFFSTAVPMLIKDLFVIISARLRGVRIRSRTFIMYLVIDLAAFSLVMGLFYWSRDIDQESARRSNKTPPIDGVADDWDYEKLKLFNNYKPRPMIIFIFFMTIIMLKCFLGLLFTGFLGELVQIIISMLIDSFRFLFLYIILLIFFSVVGYMLFFDIDEFKSFLVSFNTLYGSALGDFDFEIFSKSKEYEEHVGKIYLFIYLLISAILLLNFLIAIMSDTYARLSEYDKGLQMIEIVNVRALYEDDPYYSSLHQGSTASAFYFIPLNLAVILCKSKKLNKINLMIQSFFNVTLARLFLCVFMFVVMIFKLLVLYGLKTVYLFKSGKNLCLKIVDYIVTLFLFPAILIYMLFCDFIIFFGNALRYNYIQKVIETYKNEHNYINSKMDGSIQQDQQFSDRIESQSVYYDFKQFISSDKQIKNGYDPSDDMISEVVLLIMIGTIKIAKRRVKKQLPSSYPDDSVPMYLPTSFVVKDLHRFMHISKQLRSMIFGSEYTPEDYEQFPEINELVEILADRSLGGIHKTDQGDYEFEDDGKNIILHTSSLKNYDQRYAFWKQKLCKLFANSNEQWLLDQFKYCKWYLYKNSMSMDVGEAPELAKAKKLVEGLKDEKQAEVVKAKRDIYWMDRKLMKRFMRRHRDRLARNKLGHQIEVEKIEQKKVMMINLTSMVSYFVGFQKRIRDLVKQKTKNGERELQEDEKHALETKTQMAMRRFASSNFSTNYIASESFFNQ